MTIDKDASDFLPADSMLKAAPFSGLLYSTARITTKTAEGNSQSGVGFFYTCVDDRACERQFLVTNTEVIANGLSGQVLFPEATGSDKDASPTGNFIKVDFTDFKNLWIPHPSANIDLAAMPLDPVFLPLARSGKHVYRTSVTKDLFPTSVVLSNLTLVQRYLMIGYPIDSWDSTKGLPVLSRVLAATHPAVEYRGNRGFVIDALCVRGSSGSPIFLCDFESNDSKTVEAPAGDRCVFLGVLRMVPVFQRGTPLLVKPNPNKGGPDSPIHLGCVINAAEVEILALHAIQTRQSA